MRKILFTAVFSLPVSFLTAQTVMQKIQRAWQQFENDSQLKHAISSLYVIDAKTGQVVFDKNSQIGLAPASTQKIVTAATAFELLGKDYKYQTQFDYSGNIKDSFLTGNIYIKGNGDPTLGSPRYATTSSDEIQKRFIGELHKRKIYFHRGGLFGIVRDYDHQRIPDGWIWQDVGNYYGSGTASLNWNENQYELILKPGKKAGDSVKIIGTNPEITNQFINELKSAPKSSGDNAYIYFEPGSHINYVKGTVPCCVNTFKISGSVDNGNYFTLSQLASFLKKNNFKEKGGTFHMTLNDQYPEKTELLYIHFSPSLDSIIYWFLQKSINLYGEALIKTFAYEKQGFGSTDSGLVIVKDFWKKKGIDETELNIDDGSGLSPQNRVTTHAQVEILKYAKKQPWFSYFYTSLPEYNDMKMKSGTIKDVKGYCGYHKAKDGKEYIFSFLVNNYNGPSSSLVSKMYRVLDVLK